MAPFLDAAEHVLRELAGPPDAQTMGAAGGERPALERGELLLEALLRFGNDTVLTLDAEGRITYFSRVPAGQSVAEVVGRRAEEFLASEDRERLRQALATVRATGVAYAFECRTSETPARWLSVRLALLPGGVANSGFVAVVTDVTGQHEADDLRRRLAALVEYAADAIVGISCDGTIAEWNRGAEALFGVPSAEACGRRFLEFVPEGEHARELAIFERALAGHSTPAAEGRRLRADAGEVNVGAATFPHRIENGRVVAVTQVVRNLSPLRALEAEVEQAQRLAVQGRLAAAAAHEIANCLAIVHGNALVLDELVAEPEAARRITALVHAAVLGGTLCGQLRDLSRPQPPAPERIDLVMTVRRVFLMLERIVRQHLVLRIETDGALWVLADHSHVDQILLNLVLNARDATPLGGTITIRLGQAERRGLGAKWCRLEVLDNGTGIPAEIQGQLFKNWVTTKSLGQGTGLGLSTVHRLVRGMGGELELASDPGKGTRVRILLPPPPELA